MSEKMKDSGVDWIGEIPEGWEVTKIKFSTTLNGRIGWQGLTSSEYQTEGPYLITGTDFNNGKVNFETAVHIENHRWEEAKHIQIKNGDLLITKDGTVGKVAIVTNLNDKASLNSGVLKIQPQPVIYTKFLYYVLISEEFWLWFNYTNSGASTILHLYQNVFDEFSYAIPLDIRQQKSIANYLDKQTSKFDQAQKLLKDEIERLRAYKKSLIYETVTKGLDKNVQFKDSEVDWIGEIPEDWETKRFKYLYDYANTGEAITKEFWEEDGEVLLYTAGQNPVRTNYIEFPISRVTTDRDVLVARNGAGAIQIPEKNSIYTDHVIRFSTRNLTNRNFIYYCLSLGLEKIVSEQIDVSLKTLSKSDWDQLQLPFPATLEEQQAIADYLDKKINKVDQIIKIKEQQLTNLSEQCKTLIYEVVTGKK